MGLDYNPGSADELFVVAALKIVAFLTRSILSIILGNRQ